MTRQDLLERDWLTLPPDLRGDLITSEIDQALAQGLYVRAELEGDVNWFRERKGQLQIDRGNGWVATIHRNWNPDWTWSAHDPSEGPQ